jgi:hypothetical protein
VAPKDFAGFKNGPRIAGASQVPIIGGPEWAPAQVRDALGRILHEGDLVSLQTVAVQPYRVLKIQQMPPQVGSPPMMQIVLQSISQFLAPRDRPNTEFLRIMTLEETKQVAGAAPPEIDPSLKDGA